MLSATKLDTKRMSVFQNTLKNALLRMAITRVNAVLLVVNRQLHAPLELALELLASSSVSVKRSRICWTNRMNEPQSWSKTYLLLLLFRNLMVWFYHQLQNRKTSRFRFWKKIFSAAHFQLYQGKLLLLMLNRDWQLAFLMIVMRK